MRNERNDIHDRTSSSKNSELSKTSEEILMRYVKDKVNTIPGSHNWTLDFKTEMGKKIKDIIILELKVY